MTSTRTLNRKIFLSILFLFSTWIFLRDKSTEALYISLPILAAIWICIFFAVALWKRDREFPILDIGMLCVAFTALYTIVPLLNYYFGGLKFGLLSDARLQRHAPSAEELGFFFTNHIVYLAALASSYLSLRRSNRLLPRYGVKSPPARTVKVLVVGFIILSAYFAILLYVLGIGFRSGYGNEQHISEGPLWLAQLNGKAAEIKVMFQSAVLGLLVLHKSNFRARWFLFIFIAGNIASAITQPGSRGEVIWLLVLTFLFWYKFHGVPRRFIFIFLPTVFIFFMFLGLLRSFDDLSDLVFALDAFETVASATNEFQVLLGTSYDVSQMIVSGVVPPTVLAFNDLMPMLPPQQIWPFAKLSAADWYLIQIGQQGTGVGFLWSVISQSLIGLGMVELVIRGVVLGWFLARVHHWYQRRYTEFLPTVIYVVLCIMTLFTFRDTTGTILWTIWWAILPFVVIVYIWGSTREFSRYRSALEPASSSLLDATKRV